MGSNIVPVREKLDAEESAAIRAQLIQEIKTLPEDEVQLRAIAILKAKNRLSTGDANLVEEVFAAKMARAATPEAPVAEELSSAPSDRTAPSGPQLQRAPNSMPAPDTMKVLKPLAPR